MTGGRAVAIEDLVLLKAAAVVEILHAGEMIHLRQKGVVAEGVRRKVDLEILHAPFFGKVLPSVGNMPQHGLGIGHIVVCLHPRGRGAFPAAFPDAGFDRFHHFRVVFFHDLIDRRLRLGKMEVRVFLHQGQHGAEGSQRGGHRLRVAPHPVHVNMRMGCQDQLIGFCFLCDRLQDFLCLFTGLIGQYALGLLFFQQIIQRFLQSSVVFAVFCLG